MSLTLADLRDYIAGKTVALVGNAASLLETDFGTEIDTHDVVVRMNLGLPIPEIAGSHGERMDVWSGSLVCGGRAFMPSDEFSLPDGWNDKVRQVWQVPWNRGLRVAPALKPKLYVVEQWNEVSKRMQHRVPSGIGIAYLLIAYLEPKMVDLYGFDFWETPSWPTKQKGNLSDNKRDIQLRWIDAQERLRLRAASP